MPLLTKTLRQTALAAGLGIALSTAFVATADAATVATNGSTLTLRSTASSSGTALANIPSGANIAVQCRTTGQSISGSQGTTTTWDKVSYGGKTGYVSAAWVVGGNASNLPWCGSATVSGTVSTSGSTLTVRNNPSTSGTVLTNIPNGTKITLQCKTPGTSVTGSQGTSSSWVKVTYGGKTGYVSAAWVTGANNSALANCTNVPAPPKPAPSVDNPHGPSWGPNGGWTPRAAWLRDQIKARFGSDCTTYRSGSGEHATGNGLDCWGSTETRRKVANWAVANAGPLEVYYVIHEQKIWNIARKGDGWRPMEDRGSITANHFDHVHISMQTPSNEY